MKGTSCFVSFADRVHYLKNTEQNTRGDSLRREAGNQRAASLSEAGQVSTKQTQTAGGKQIQQMGMGQK